MTKHNVWIKPDLDECQLQSQNMESIGTLAGGVAHEFNNILTVVIGACTLLEMKPASSFDQEEYITQIRTAAERAAHLTQSLLAFSRKQTICKRCEDLALIIRNQRPFLGRIIGEDIRFSVGFPESPVMVMVDRVQIEQVLIDLAANSRDAMQDGGNLDLTLSVPDSSLDDLEAEEERTGDDYALITVTDTGAGMDMATQQRIFEPFFTTKDPGKGIGLGLSMAYGIIRQHDGVIQVQSEPGEGTVFRIYLPLRDQPAKDTTA